MLLILKLGFMDLWGPFRKLQVHPQENNPIWVCESTDNEKMAGVNTLTPSLEGVKQLMELTYRETVLLGRKLGCRVSIKSISSHTTLIRTCCLLSSLDLSAEQWQLSTIRSGQFLLLRLECHSPIITHSKLNAFMVDCDLFLFCFVFYARYLSSYVLPASVTNRDHFT